MKLRVTECNIYICVRERKKETNKWRYVGIDGVERHQGERNCREIDFQKPQDFIVCTVCMPFHHAL